MPSASAAPALKTQGISLTLTSIFAGLGLTLGANTKIVRHQDPSHDLHDLYRRGIEFLEEYQRHQSRPVFDSAEYVVSFLATEQMFAKFVGIYRCEGPAARKGEKGYPTSFHPPEIVRLFGASAYYYTLKRKTEFDELRDRLIVDWRPSNPRNWVMSLDGHDKSVFQLHPPGYVKDWTDYLGFTLTFDELTRVVRSRQANSPWRDALSATGGVYVILDTETGQQYVGSASGEGGGIFGRWTNYVETGGHGGNVELIPIVNRGGAAKFVFSLLDVLPLSAKKQIVQREGLWKQKLGSRAHGLNKN